MRGRERGFFVSEHGGAAGRGGAGARPASGPTITACRFCPAARAAIARIGTIEVDNGPAEEVRHRVRVSPGSSFSPTPSGSRTTARRSASASTILAGWERAGAALAAAEGKRAGERRQKLMATRRARRAGRSRSCTRACSTPRARACVPRPRSSSSTAASSPSRARRRGTGAAGRRRDHRRHGQDPFARAVGFARAPRRGRRAHDDCRRRDHRARHGGEREGGPAAARRVRGGQRRRSARRAGRAPQQDQRSKNRPKATYC